MTLSPERSVPDEKSPFDISNVRHLRRVAIPGLAYLVMAVAAVRTPPGSVTRLALTFGILVAFVWIMATDLAAIRRLDELGRRIHGEAAVLTLGIAITALTIFALLPFVSIATPQVPWIWVPSFLWTIWGLSVVLIGRRYR